MAAKKKAAVRAGNFFWVRASHKENDIFHSSHLIWAKKAEWGEVTETGAELQLWKIKTFQSCV